MTKLPAAAKHLSKEAKGLWDSIVSTWVLDQSQLLMLRTGLESFCRMQEAREIIKREGIVQNTGKLKRIHPACQVEKDAMRGFMIAWKTLGFCLYPATEAEPVTGQRMKQGGR